MPTRPYIPERYEFITGGDPLKWDDDIDTVLIIGGDEPEEENPYRADPRLSNLFRGAAEYDVGVSYLDEEVGGGTPVEEVTGGGTPVGGAEVHDPLTNMQMHLEKRGSYLNDNPTNRTTIQLNDNVVSEEIVSQSFVGSGDALGLDDMIIGGSDDEDEEDLAAFDALLTEEAITGGGDLSIADMLE